VNVVMTPPVTFLIMLVLGIAFFMLAKKIAARGKDHPSKRQPYACGEEFETEKLQLKYHTFFRLALVFGILHIISLVITTMPKDISSRMIALLYLIAAALTMLILFENDAKDE